MINNKRILLLALAFPILALVSLTIYKKNILSTGVEVTFPITGYDPRDLLSGHYLIYRINYGIEDLCPSNTERLTAYVCIEPKKFSYLSPDGCSKFIRGVCNGNRFEAGVEKFFVPEDKAAQLDLDIRSGSASIVLSVTPDGRAQVKNLLINGLPWNQH